MENKLEIIGFNIESCVAAQEAGADRIELCASPGEGGTTASYGLIKSAREKLHIDLYAMVRPRGGDFLYDDDDFEMMKIDVEFCKKSGCDGIVTGILTTDGKVDKKRCKQLIDLAYPLEATFHRAFDRVKDPIEALEEIIDLGFERILTSGLKPKAVESTALLAELIKKADGRIVIMPGSGVIAQNIISIAEATGAKEFHSSASVSKGSLMEYANSEMNENLNHISVNKDAVKKMKELLNEFRKNEKE
ncbi:MAG: copper homeostasis protein CutC [Ginsengibacter sp.]